MQQGWKKIKTKTKEEEKQVDGGISQTVVLRREREAWTEVQTFAQQRRAMCEIGGRDTENWHVGVCVWQVYGFRSLQTGQISSKPSWGVRNTIMERPLQK